jgi:transposase
MTVAARPLTDLDALRAAFAAQQAVLTAERAETSRLSGALAAQRAEKARVIEQNDRLRQIIRQLQRMQFGKRSERIDPAQFTLALEELEQAVAAVEAEQEKRKPAVKSERTRQRGQARSSLPGHLPRIELVVEPEDMACPCCGGAMHVIGEDRSERLDVIPAQYQVIVTRRPKYACRSCEGAVVQAPAPPRLIEGGLPTEQLVADVVVGKYADHCPLYRQAQILARQSLPRRRPGASRSTAPPLLSGWAMPAPS